MEIISHRICSGPTINVVLETLYIYPYLKLRDCQVYDSIIIIITNFFLRFIIEKVTN